MFAVCIFFQKEKKMIPRNFLTFLFTFIQQNVCVKVEKIFLLLFFYAFSQFSILLYQIKVLKFECVRFC